MSTFSYLGKSSQGRAVKGQIEAATEVEARVKLRAQRIIPIKVVLQVQGGTSSKKVEYSFSQFFKTEPTVKSKDLQIFTRQFATLINSGIPIVQSIDILGTQTASPVLKMVLKKVKSSVEGGKRLGESIEGWPRVFDRLYVSLVKAGEEGGVLDVILNRLAVYIEKAGKLKSQIVGAMWYPAGVLIVAGLVVSGLLIFVIPKFEAIFKGAGQDLPGLTKLLIDISHSFKQLIFVFIGVVMVLVAAIRKYYGTVNGRMNIDSILIQAPLFGSLIQKSAIARFTRTMSTMLSSGVAIMDSLEICANVVGNAVVEKAIRKAKVAISEGKSITQPLSQEPFIPQMVVQMIGVGETTGTLDVMLGKIADFYEDEVDAAVGALTSVMEPLMMVFLGSIIAVVVIGMYLPIFNLAGAVK
jgi:type IV pilus assembly protein PilC